MPARTPKFSRIRSAARAKPHALRKFPWETFARTDTAAVPQQVAVSIRRSESDATLQVSPGSPRAAAHMWGKGARILQRSIDYHI